MTYVVLARKYRPQTLSEVIGQDAVVTTLKNAINLRRIHHAYLFTGARGVGKTSIARILAKSLNCEKGPTDTPCGVCAACTEIAKSASPDVLEIDGASNTGVDDVRDLRETVKYLPSRGKHKVYIIDEVHMLSTAAFNALLKTLEEPPEHVVFVFATTEPHKIPITILSRCQRFDFRRVPQSILEERLQSVATAEQIEIEKPALQAIAKAADGSVRDSMSLFDQVIAFCGNKIALDKAQQALGLLDRAKVRGLLAGILAKDRQQVSQLVQEANATGADLSEIAERLVEAVRDLTLAKLTQGQAQTLSGMMPEELQALLDQASALSSNDLHRLFNVLVKTAEDTAKSPFATLTFEMGLLRACDLEPVSALVDIVNALRGEGGAGPSGGGGGGSGPMPRGPVQKTVVQAPQSAFMATAPKVEAPKPMPVAPPMPVVDAKPIEKIETLEKPIERPAPPKPVDKPIEKPTTYKAFAAAVASLKPTIGAALENVVCDRFSDDEIVVSVPPNNHVFGDMLRDKENQATIADVVTKVLGRRVAFVVNDATGNAPQTIADERRAERNAEVKELKTAGAAHPAVQKVLETFGGEIRSVQVKAALSRPAEDYD